MLNLLAVHVHVIVVVIVIIIILRRGLRATSEWLWVISCRRSSRRLTAAWYLIVRDDKCVAKNMTIITVCNGKDFNQVGCQRGRERQNLMRIVRQLESLWLKEWFREGLMEGLGLPNGRLLSERLLGACWEVGWVVEMRHGLVVVVIAEQERGSPWSVLVLGGFYVKLEFFIVLLLFTTRQLRLDISLSLLCFSQSWHIFISYIILLSSISYRSPHSFYHISLPQFVGDQELRVSAL